MNHTDPYSPLRTSATTLWLFCQMLEQTEWKLPPCTVQHLVAANRGPEKQRSEQPYFSVLLVIKCCSVDTTMLNFNTSLKKKKKRKKISYLSLFCLFFFFQRKFSARKRPWGPSHWERVDTFNSPWHIQFTSPYSGCQRHQLAPLVVIFFFFFSNSNLFSKTPMGANSLMYGWKQLYLSHCQRWHQRIAWGLCSSGFTKTTV